MLYPQDCRDNARSCINMANSSEDAKVQSLLFDTADAWTKLAVDLEQSSAPSSQTYRGKAIACEQRAEETKDRTIRRQWEDLAMQWHLRANQSARLYGEASKTTS